MKREEKRGREREWRGDGMFAISVGCKGKITTHTAGNFGPPLHGLLSEIRSVAACGSATEFIIAAMTNYQLQLMLEVRTPIIYSLN